jgi:hypothetical protein
MKGRSAACVELCQGIRFVGSRECGLLTRGSRLDRYLSRVCRTPQKRPHGLGSLDSPSLMGRPGQPRSPVAASCLSGVAVKGNWCCTKEASPVRCIVPASHPCRDWGESSGVWGDQARGVECDQSLQTRHQNTVTAKISRRQCRDDNTPNAPAIV